MTSLPELRAERRSDPALFEAIVETVREPLALLDDRHGVRLANRAFLAAFSRTTEQTVGRSLFDLEGVQWNAAELRTLLEEILPDRRVLEGFRLDTEDRRVFVLNARRLEHAGEELVLLALEDATERLRAHDELERRVAERTAELEAFSYSVSHDLRAPLRTVDGFTQALVEDYGGDLPPEALRYLQLVRRGARSMGEMIDGLLQFSRLGRQGIERQRVAVDDVLRDVLHELEHAREGRRIAFRIGELGTAFADRVLLARVFANLLGNAIKYTAAVDEAVIEVGSAPGAGERVWFVRDNGVGFDPEHAAKLFEVFQRLHRAEEYEGAGIGLAIARRSVALHGGRIWAEAAPGAGATFSFALPDPPPEAPA